MAVMVLAFALVLEEQQLLLVEVEPQLQLGLKVLEVLD